jgi:hypothetical protein
MLHGAGLMASILYGTDLQALLDLPDPEIVCSEQVNAVYACARRWVTPDGELTLIGETQQYASICVLDWLGGSFDLNDPTVLNDLSAQATAVLLEEPFAANAIATATFGGGVLTLTAQVQGSPGPLFALVVANGVSGVTVQLLMPGQS